MGWLGQIDRDRFRVFGYNTGAASMPKPTPRAHAAVRAGPLSVDAGGEKSRPCAHI